MLPELQQFRFALYVEDPQQATAEGAPRLLRTSGVAKSIGLSASRSRGDFANAATLRPSVLLGHLSPVVRLLLGELASRHVRQIRREAHISGLKERATERCDGCRRMGHAVNSVQEIVPGAIKADIVGDLERDADPHDEARPR